MVRICCFKKKIICVTLVMYLIVLKLKYCCCCCSFRYETTTTQDNSVCLPNKISNKKENFLFFCYFLLKNFFLFCFINRLCVMSVIYLVERNTRTNNRLLFFLMIYLFPNSQREIIISIKKRLLQFTHIPAKHNIITSIVIIIIIEKKKKAEKKIPK